jgi:hypothetical protein
VVTIHHLEIRFDVAAEGDEARFAELFERHIRSWNRLREEAEVRRKRSEGDRSLGDRPTGGTR